MTNPARHRPSLFHGKRFALTNSTKPLPQARETEVENFSRQVPCEQEKQQRETGARSPPGAATRGKAGRAKPTRKPASTEDGETRSAKTTTAERAYSQSAPALTPTSPQLQVWVPQLSRSQRR